MSAPDARLERFFYRDTEATPSLPSWESPAAADRSGPAQDVEALVFRVAGQSFGLPLERVAEVVRLRPVTRLPRAPAGVLGVVELRGKVIGVFEAPAPHVRPATEARGPHQRLVVLRTSAGDAALRVDQVVGVQRLSTRPEDQTPRLKLVDVEAMFS